MSQHERFNSKPQTPDSELYDKCSHCGGYGWEYVDGIPLHTVPCSYCGGTGRGKRNQSNIIQTILVILFFIGIGYLISKYLI